MTYRAREIAERFELIAPINSGLAGDELGFVYGNSDIEVHGLACMWQANVRSIEMAAACGANLLIVHETIFLPEQQSGWYDVPAVIKPNRLRRELLDRHQITVYRSHSNWDTLPVDGVPDQAVASLGIDGLEVVTSQKFFRVHRLPRKMKVSELASRASRGLAFDGMRIFGESNRSVSAFAFLIGGFGENQWHMPQLAKALGAEAILIGEMSEFIVVGAMELGLPVIETLHSVSESPAIRRQAQMLAQRLPGLPVYFVPSGAPAFTPGVAAERMGG